MKYIFIVAYFFSSVAFAGHCSAGASHDEDHDEKHSEMIDMKDKMKSMKDKMKSMKESEEDDSAEAKKESDKDV